MSGKNRDDGEELYTQVLFDPNDHRLSPAPKPVAPQTLTDDEFFANPLAASRDYVPAPPFQQPETSEARRGDFARRLGNDAVNPPMQPSTSVLGVEEAATPQEPLTKANMGTEFFKAEAPDLSALSPAVSREVTTDQKRDAEMGWGAGGSALVDGLAELHAMDEARRQAAAQEVGGKPLMDAMRDFTMQDAAQAATLPSDPSSSISRRLSGGEVQTDREAKSQDGSATAASRTISQRLAGALSPQAETASANPDKPQTRGGWVR